MRRFERFSLLFWALAVLIVLAHLGYLLHFFQVGFIWDLIHLAGHFAGITGFIAMALSLLYVARKKKWFTRGQVKFWYEWHVTLGLIGPLAIAFHSYGKYFGLGGLALACVWLVLLTGIIGHFLFRRLPEEVRARAETYRERLEELARLEENINKIAGEIDRLKEEFVDTGLLAEVVKADHYKMPRPRLTNDPRDIPQIWREYRRSARQVSILKQRVRDRRREERQASANRETELIELLALQRDAQNLAVLNEIFSLWRKIHVPLSWFMWWLAALHLWAWIYY